MPNNILPSPAWSADLRFGLIEEIADCLSVYCLLLFCLLLVFLSIAKILSYLNCSDCAVPCSGFSALSSLLRVGETMMIAGETLLVWGAGLSSSNAQQLNPDLSSL